MGEGEVSFINFDEFYSTTIITLVWWTSIIGTILGVIIISYPFFKNDMAPMGLLVIIGGAFALLITRMYLEYLIVQFKIYEELEYSNNLKEKRIKNGK